MLVLLYRHLGTATAVAAAMGPEVSIRVAIVRQETAKLRGRVFRSPSLEPARKICIALGLVLSRGLFQAASWPRLSVSQHRRFHAAIIALYRAALQQKEAGPQELTDVQFIAHFALVPPMVLLRMLRVQLAIRMACRSPPIVWAMVAAAGSARQSWWAALEEDIAWFAQWTELRRWRGASVEQVLDDCRRDPKAARKHVRQAAKVSAGAAATWAVTKAQSEITEIFRCSQCSFEAISRQALAVHAARAHQQRRAARFYVDVPHCPACLVHFHTRERVIEHLHHKAHKCLEFVLSTFQPLSAEALEKAEEEALSAVQANRRAGRRRAWASLPCVRAAGPLQEGVHLRCLHRRAA